MHWESDPDSSTEKGSADSSSLHLNQFLHLGVHMGGQEGGVLEVPTDLGASGNGSRRGRATSPGRPSAPPSLSGRPCPLVGPIPGYLAPAWAAPRAAHIVAPGPARTPSLTSARALHQPPQRCRRLAIHAVPSARRVPASPPPLPLPQGPDAQPGPRVLDSGAGFWRWLTLFLPSTSRKMTLRQRRRSKARPRGLRC